MYNYVKKNPEIERPAYPGLRVQWKLHCTAMWGLTDHDLWTKYLICSLTLFTSTTGVWCDPFYVPVQYILRGCMLTVDGKIGGACQTLIVEYDVVRDKQYGTSMSDIARRARHNGQASINLSATNGFSYP